jgi:multicomponent Na+:H+ antiporter subunit D
MFMMACLFTVAGSITAYRGSRSIEHLRGLHRTMPVTLAVFVAGALSVVGVPPFCGFFSKWYLVLGTIQAGQWVYLGVLLTGSLLNAILFFRVLEKAYFELRDESGHTEPHGRRRLLIDRIPVTELAPMVALAILLILLGLFSNTIISGVIEHAIPQTMRVY